MSSKKELLKQIRDEVLALDYSPLYAIRIANKVFPVIGEGSHDAALMFVGEAPGKNEAATGRPFCGAAGKLLDQFLVSIGLPRESVYITNIVKDRPPENREPTPEEIAIYAPFLDRQIEIIRPKVLVPLGRHSTGYIMKRFQLASELKPISLIHGKVFEGRAPHGPITVVPLYHPAVAIYNQHEKPTLLKDFETLKRYL